MRTRTPGILCDRNGHVVLAALRVPPAPPRPRIALKLLVDCSGSMGGDRIASARQALGACWPGSAKVTGSA